MRRHTLVRDLCRITLRAALTGGWPERELDVVQRVLVEPNPGRQALCGLYAEDLNACLRAGNICKAGAGKHMALDMW